MKRRAESDEDQPKYIQLTALPSTPPVRILSLVLPGLPDFPGSGPLDAVGSVGTDIPSIHLQIPTLDGVILPDGTVFPPIRLQGAVRESSAPSDSESILSRSPGSLGRSIATQPTGRIVSDVRLTGKPPFKHPRIDGYETSDRAGRTPDGSSSGEEKPSVLELPAEPQPFGGAPVANGSQKLDVSSPIRPAPNPKDKPSLDHAPPPHDAQGSLPAHDTS